MIGKVMQAGVPVSGAASHRLYVPHLFALLNPWSQRLAIGRGNGHTCNRMVCARWYVETESGDCEGGGHPG